MHILNHTRTDIPSIKRPTLLNTIFRFTAQQMPACHKAVESAVPASLYLSMRPLVDVDSCVSANWCCSAVCSPATADFPLAYAISKWLSYIVNSVSPSRYLSCVSLGNADTENNLTLAGYIRLQVIVHTAVANQHPSSPSTTSKLRSRHTYDGDTRQSMHSECVCELCVYALCYPDGYDNDDKDDDDARVWISRRQQSCFSCCCC